MNVPERICIPMQEFEAALNRCMVAHPAKGFVLSGDARLLAEVYGLCIHAQAREVDLSLYPQQAATVRRWLA